ncbi:MULTISPECIES: formyltetrahydrofolate deformylase [Auritidibacter]|uniref:Formyltetrahydrofolate deformylase n=1 Tax=Auritidibacter ignavus TaxID=678932 RepID=A0AAJ6DDE5_9MICC|nr:MULTISPECIES: formyltetrahydrofolate deformylase [Auritidibacter]PXA76260.1 formyltetrahydrofolate deformylase [Auritidibacter sp. NML100628]PXA79566.1 formyltetrahydrofolate deformylase [Auritidibacter sp. NML120636]WGH80502.1 formyltetrahydrofolate deformylase [Auritidibacter ignavus]WGH84964.1 formyltetrahydrofolate deformylase [Auritidibacter ignavus]WGH89754.1 formyltetrahydrofolate deformylase [Auritidibacter ignavus]
MPADTAAEHRLVVTLSCANQPGIVHAITGCLLKLEGDITESQQFGSPDTGTFFMRVTFTSPYSRDEADPIFDQVREDFAMDLNVWDANGRTKTIIMCSKDGRTLNELLFQQRAGTLPIDVPVIVSNHLDLQPMAYFYDIPFVHIPLVKNADGTDNKADAEARLMQLVNEYNVELVVLARYMQILSDELVQKLEGKAINIHHSFLPSFKGAKPYHQAHARGVKLIGATAHYVTADLDEGPIIEQRVHRVNHGLTAGDFVDRGRSVEGATLAQAVQWHAEHRVLLDGRRTVIFE